MLNSLTFGDFAQQSAIKKRFGNNDHTTFDMMELVDDSIYSNEDYGNSKDYFYFLKLVPHVFVDEVHQEEYTSYSYSLNHNSKVINLDANLVAISNAKLPSH